MDDMLAIKEEVHRMDIMHPMNRKTDLEWADKANELTGVLKDVLAGKDRKITLSYNNNQLDRDDIRHALERLTGTKCIPGCMNAYV